jgi:hypothetical protein
VLRNCSTSSIEPNRIGGGGAVGDLRVFGVTYEDADSATRESFERVLVGDVVPDIYRDVGRAVKAQRDD